LQLLISGESGLLISPQAIDETTSVPYYHRKAEFGVIINVLGQWYFGAGQVFIHLISGHTEMQLAHAHARLRSGICVFTGLFGSAGLFKSDMTFEEIQIEKSNITANEMFFEMHNISLSILQ